MTNTGITTAEIIAFLQEPSSYPHHPPAVHLLQTHASVLAVAPPFVYKVKKHVDLGFMKFTTLQERKTNCERELLLNSRFCPDLYVGVVPVAARGNQLAFGADGEVVEYALQMNQLPDGFFMNQLLAAGGITTAVLDDVLQVLQAFYLKYRSDATISSYGDLANIRQTTDDNLATLQEHAGPVIQPAALQVITFFLHTYLQRHEALFHKRVQELRIQDCHGDLHLDHIHIRQGRICIFDCIEFNDRFRYIDVACDIAFLAMDLDFHGRPDLAVYLSSRLAELLQDPDMHLLVDYYKCTRACVRAKVDYIRAEEGEVPAAERLQSCERVTRYISLALRYALFGSKPTVLLVFGRVGSGKTTVAEQLAQLLGSKHHSSDIVRKSSTGTPLYQRTRPEERERLYAQEVNDRVYNTLLHEALAGAGNMRHVVVDATFSKSSRRAAFVKALEEQQVNYYFLEVSATDEVIKQRLAQREHKEQVVSDARLDDFERLNQAFQEPDELQPDRLIKVDAASAVNEVVQRVLLELAQRNPLLSVTR